MNPLHVTAETWVFIVLRIALPYRYRLGAEHLELLQRDKGTPHIRGTVSPSVLDRRRNHDSRILHEMEKQFGGNLTFRADPSMHQEEFQLTNVDTGKRV